MITLYALVDPRFPRRFRYIGVTCSPERRLKEHRTARWCSNLQLRAWITSLLSEGKVAEMVALATFPNRNAAEEAEWRLIGRLKRRGLADLNSQPLAMKQIRAMGEARERRGMVWPSIRRVMEQRHRKGAAA